MATVNKALKKRAQAFAEKHGLPYLKALKAVDEPLHGLRDLTAPYTDSRPQSGARHFRLVKASGSYASPYDASSYPEKKQHPIFQRLNQGVSHFKSRSEFLRTMGLRTGIIEDCGAEDIWSYRALYRAGLLQADAPVLEPFFHHHEHGLEHGFDALRSEGAKLGVYELNFSSYLWVEKAGSSYPLTLQELDGLLAGELSAAEVQAPLDDSDRVWKERYRYRAVSKNRSPKADRSRGETQPVLQLFLEEDPRKVRYDLPEGLHWNAFDLEGIEFSRFEFLDWELSNRRNGLRLLRDGKVEQISAHEAVFSLDPAEDQSREKIEVPLITSGSDDGAFYRLQEAHEVQTAKEDRQNADRETVNYFVDLIDNFLEGMDRSERSSLRPVIQDLISQGSVTMEAIVTELRSAQSPTARELGARIVRATGVSVIYSTTGKTAEKGSAVDILNALGLNDYELRSAREEVALERDRESMVQSMNSLCWMLISNFDMRFEENRKLIRDFALRELDENGGANFLAGIIRALRNSDSLDARRIGAKLIDGLATLDDADEETSDEVHAIISSMQTTATRIDELEEDSIPYSHITHAAADLGIKLKLDREGNYCFGDCPFHEDRGSFLVFPEKELFQCNSCGRSGDAERLGLEWYHRNDKGWDRELDGLIEENFS